MRLSKTVKCAVAGAIAGAANGFFGAGGGMALVPLFRRWAKVEERSSYATSVVVILPLCAVSAAIYFIRADISLLEALPYLAGGLVGGFVGGRTFKHIPLELLRRVLGAFIIYGGIRALL